MALSIRVTGLDASGVGLLSPTQPEFDELARPLLGDRIADVGLRLKPMLVIVSNESVETVVSLALVWHVAHENGRTSRFWQHTSFPELICGDTAISRGPTGLAPGQRRIEANGLVIHGWGSLDEYYDQFLGQFVDQKEAMLAHAVDLHIELNAVIFADGTIVGPDDESMLSDLFSTYVSAKQEWYRGIIGALDAGESVIESFAPVERFLADRTKQMRSGDRIVTDSPADFCRDQTAADATRWRRRFADDDLPSLMKRAIRLDPFTIRRRRFPDDDARVRK